jgi:protein ImuB
VIPDSQQFQLFESPLRDPNRFGETLARLAVLVGEGRVGVVQLEDTHRPDGFHFASPQFEKLGEHREGEASPSRTLGLPLQRFRPPYPAQVRLQRYMPVFVFSEKVGGEIVDAAGPYRLSGSWWDRGIWAVEEWDIALGNGALYRISKHQDAWFVEGCYDAPLR